MTTRAAFWIGVLAGVHGCGGSNGSAADAPFGAACASTEACAESLTCSGGKCRGALGVPVSVDIQTTVSSSELLSIGLYDPESVAQVGQGRGLDPSVALLDLEAPPPVTYPVETSFGGVVAGTFVIYAYVPDPSTPGQIRIGHNDFRLSDNGSLETGTGDPIDRVAVAIVGISILEGTQ